MFHREGTFFFFSDRMPPAVGVNVVLEGQRCAHELILGMSRRAWRQRSRVQKRWSGRGGRRAALENGFWSADVQ